MRVCENIMRRRRRASAVPKVKPVHRPGKSKIFFGSRIELKFFPKMALNLTAIPCNPTSVSSTSFLYFSTTAWITEAQVSLPVRKRWQCMKAWEYPHFPLNPRLKKDSSGYFLPGRIKYFLRSERKMF